MDIRTVLSEKSAGYLADLVIKLLDGLDEKKRLDFIGKHISAGFVVQTLAERDEHVLDQETIIQRVEDFCIACLNGSYFVDAEYDHYYDAYNEDDFINSEWADCFAEYIRLAVLYARNGDESTAYEMFERLFACIHKCEQDYELLGTDVPLNYIDIDKSDAFEIFFSSIQKVKEDAFKAYDRMFAVWSLFERYCEPLLYKFITDLTISTEVVVNRIKNDGNFLNGEKMLLMLEKIHMKNNAPFDKLKISKELLSHHDNFGYYAACGYYEKKQWRDAINAAKEYQEKTNGGVKEKLKSLLTDAYEKNHQFREAYDNSLSMFCEYQSYELYKRTRYLAEKVHNVGIDLFFSQAKDCLSKSKSYNAKNVHMEILSFEGEINALIDLCSVIVSSENYDLLKYSAKSLVFRALGGKSEMPANLSEYIADIIDSQPNGITDMLPHSDDINSRDILLPAVNILKKQIQFHIDAANRSRYAKAAYYLGIAVDIYNILGEADKGKAYISLLMTHNNRRPAFKDEVKQKLGF